MSKSIELNDLELECVLPNEFSINAKAGEVFIEQIKIINKLPFNKGEMLYSDDVWDFSKYSKLNIVASDLRFYFDKGVDDFKDDLKNYALFKVIENKDKIQTIKGKLGHIIRFLKYANLKGYSYVEDIDYNIVDDFLKKLDKEKKSYSSITKYIYSIKNFYEFYSSNFKDIITSDLRKVLKVDPKLMSAVQAMNKTPDIPQGYYNKFVSSIIKIIDDETAPYYIRGAACIYLILSQTGLRISEVLALEIGMIKETSIFNGEKAYFLEYKTWKREKGNNSYSIEKTYINELSKKGYDKLIEIYSDKRSKMNLPYIFLGGDMMKKTSQFPVKSNSFEAFQERLFIYLDNNGYVETVNQDKEKYPNLSRKKVDDWLINSSSKYDKVDTITYPTTHQFRVHVCTELYNAGVPLQYIQKFMAHLADEMKGYYVRTTPSNPQEDIEFAYKTLENIITGDTKLLGGTGDLSLKIQEFIEKNNYNIAKDTKTIVQELAKKIPIRQKSGGVCIKSSIRECGTDYSTDEFYCSYGVCPNIFHFYYMADFSYKMAKECEEAFLYNKKSGFLKQAQKELNKLQRRVKDKLIPELDELKIVINKKGSDAVISEYPILLEIILNLDSIYEESEKWLKLKM